MKKNKINKERIYDSMLDTINRNLSDISERLLNLPVAELNNHTLREVFEQNIFQENLTASINTTDTLFNKNYLPNDLNYIRINLNYTGTFSDIFYGSLHSPTLPNRDNYITMNIIDTGYYSIIQDDFDYTRFSLYIVNPDVTINLISHYRVPLKELGIEHLTVEEMDYWFNVYQALLVSDTNAIFSLFAPKQQEAWITPTLIGATSTYIRYRKDTLGTVIVEGNITVTTAGTNMTLPLGYRPLFAYTIGNLTFNTDGTVVSSANGTQTISVRYTGGSI